MAKRPTVSQLVQDYIRDYIIKEKLRPGDPLPPEGQIAAELEVSRVSVREGVKVLATLGVLEVRHGNGLFVRGLNLDVLLDVLSYSLLFDLASLKELLQIRKLFATGMVPDVIQGIQQEDIVACRGYLRKWEENIAVDLPFHEQDRLFHLTLCQSLGNKLMLELENIFWTAYRNAEERTASLHVVKEDAPKILQAHADILSAIEARDVVLAQRLMADSFEEFKRRLELTMQASQKTEEENEYGAAIYD